MKVMSLRTSVYRDHSTALVVDLFEHDDPDLGTDCWSYADHMLIQTLLDVDQDQNGPMHNHLTTVHKVQDGFKENPDKWRHNLPGGLYTSL